MGCDTNKIIIFKCIAQLIEMFLNRKLKVTGVLFDDLPHVFSINTQ